MAPHPRKSNFLYAFGEAVTEQVTARYLGLVENVSESMKT